MAGGYWATCMGSKHQTYIFIFSTILAICVDAPRAEALRWAGHAADKMFHNFGNLLETNCTVQA